MKPVFLALAVLIAAPAAFADMDACAALKATFAPKESEIAALTEKRDDMALVLEAKGEAWDDAEVTRRFSTRHARTAELLKADYETVERALVNAEIGLQATVRQYNMDVSQYNGVCTK